MQCNINGEKKMIKHLKNFLLKQAEEMTAEQLREFSKKLPNGVIIEIKEKPSLTSRAFKTLGLITLGGLGTYGVYKLWKAKHQNQDQDENTVENSETLQGF
jgi:uncharacterized membrane protein YebE (DUF533 family)